jgi:hypothetical protein
MQKARCKTRSTHMRPTRRSTIAAWRRPAAACSAVPPRGPWTGAVERKSGSAPASMSCGWGVRAVCEVGEDGCGSRNARGQAHPADRPSTSDRCGRGRAGRDMRGETHAPPLPLQAGFSRPPASAASAARSGPATRGRGGGRRRRRRGRRRGSAAAATGEGRPFGCGRGGCGRFGSEGGRSGKARKGRGADNGYMRVCGCLPPATGSRDRMAIRTFSHRRSSFLEAAYSCSGIDCSAPIALLRAGAVR